MKKLIAVAVLFLCFTADVQAAGCGNAARPLRRAGTAISRVGRVVSAPFRGVRARRASRQAARSGRAC